MPQIPYNQPIGLSYAHIVNAGTTLVKSTPGVLHGVIFNSGVGLATLTLINNSVTTAATPVIGIPQITAGTTITATGAPTVYDLQFNTGLVVVAAGTVDATIVYK